MNKTFYTQLSVPVQKLVDIIEAYSKLEIRVELNPYPVSETDPNPNAPCGSFSSNSAVIFLRTLDHFPEQGVLYLLLLLKRYWLEKVPQIVPTGTNIENFKITSKIETALEGLVVVPIEAEYGFEPFNHWNTTVRKNWERYPFKDLNDSAKKINFLLSWLTTENLVSDEEVKKFVEECLSKEGFLLVAKNFNKDIVSNLTSKEKCLSIVIDYLNIPKSEVLLRYFDVKNGKQEDLNFPKAKHSKPSGVIGMSKLTAGIEKGIQEFMKVSFPKTKDSIELIVTNAFITSASKNDLFSFKITDFEQNKENHLDFELKTPEGVKYLELMEVAPLEKVHLYENASASYQPYDFGQYILKKISGKSDKYLGIKKTGLILLIYITDWKFYPSQTLIALLQYWTSQATHSFEYIQFYEPITDTEGITHLIYPTPKTFWTDFNPEDAKDSWTQNFDPLKLTSNSPGKWTFNFDPPKET